jgi:hypothetical protein
MAPLLYVNGIPVEASAAEVEPVRLGEVARSLNGLPRSSVRVQKKDYRFTTDVTGMARGEAEALRYLIEGEGHHWSFDVEGLSEGSTSSRGLVAAELIGSATTGDESGVHGNALVITGVLKWNMGHTGAWSAMYFQDEGGSWAHYVVRRPSLTGTPEVWRNDDKTDVDPGTVTMNTSGQLLVTDNAGGVVDDLVWLPYVVPDEWPALLWEDRMLRPWQALPFVYATGDGVPAAGMVAMGQAGTVRRVHMRDGEGGFTFGDVFDFTLIST